VAEAERAVEPEPTPAAVPVPAPVQPTAAVEPEIRKPAPVQPVVQGERLEKISRRLQADPNDHASRLAFARALRDGQQVAPSLDQYESLIESAQLLEDVTNDLGSLAEAQPDTARVRRLLGDAHMRRGMLQEALDAYRSALEQL
jgi:tetratricopeptide (TPR) repeat protein